MEKIIVKKNCWKKFSLKKKKSSENFFSLKNNFLEKKFCCKNCCKKYSLKKKFVGEKMLWEFYSTHWHDSSHLHSTHWHDSSHLHSTHWHDSSHLHSTHWHDSSHLHCSTLQGIKEVRLEISISCRISKSFLSICLTN